MKKRKVKSSKGNSIMKPNQEYTAYDHGEFIDLAVYSDEIFVGLVNRKYVQFVK